MVTTVKKPVSGGRIRAISSKSAAHRALICAALADAETKVICTDTSDDIDATVSCLNGIGAEITRGDGFFSVRPIKRNVSECTINCRESGSTLRFMLPLVCALGINTTIITSGRLKDRPLSPLWEELCAHGCDLRKKDNAIYTSGRLESGSYTISANVSSQYISGLLMALPLLGGDSVLTLTGRIESAPYIQMTCGVQEQFGIVNSFEEGSYNIRSKGYTSPGVCTAEGDWSNSAFWLCAGALLSEGITVSGLNNASVQGDKAVVDILKRFGADVDEADGEITVRRNRLKGITIDASDVPDLVPVLSAVAAAADGETVINGVRRLRLKESDRIATVESLLTAIGAECVCSDDQIRILGGAELHGAEVSSFNDHRIAMTAAVMSIITGGNMVINISDSVKKSYPDFWKHFSQLGGETEDKAG